MKASALASYNFIWGWLRLFAPIYLYFRVWRGREDKARLKERYGLSQHPRPEGQLFWLHAVSVGEAVAALSLAQALCLRSPSLNILITTNTKTAAEQIKKAANARIFHSYQPLDHPQWVDNFLTHWQPDYAVMLESDFWPNLIFCTSEHDIPICFASSQLSDTAFEAWMKRPKLAAAVFGSAQDIFVVDSEQARKFKQLISNSAKRPDIHISGSLKINSAKLDVNKAMVADLKKAAGKRPIVLAASTHLGEEKIILAASQQTCADGHNHFLIIAPRHPERGPQLAEEISGVGLRSREDKPTASDSAYICDSLGEMGSLYQAADLIILGGSFADLGGHNPLEIAPFLTPVLTGPSQFKNKAAFDALKKAGMITHITDNTQLSDSLSHAVAKLKNGESLISPSNKKEIQQVVVEACSRAEKTADYLLQKIS